MSITKTDSIAGGLDTTRLAKASADAQAAREQRDADVLAYLRRTGNDDVAEILGLAASPRRTRRRKATTNG